MAGWIAGALSVVVTGLLCVCRGQWVTVCLSWSVGYCAPVQARPIYTDRLKGVMTPPVLVDLTGDGTVDIVINPYNSSVLAIDGRTFAILWNHTVPFSESYRYVRACVRACVCACVCVCVCE